MLVVDTHCHLNILRKKGIDPNKVLRNAYENEVESVVLISTDLESSKWNRDFVQNFNREDTDIELYWTVGLHPGDAEHPEQLGEVIKMLKMCRNDKYFLGAGEIGLDYFHTTKFTSNQKMIMEKQLEIAVELKIPVVLHVRDDSRHIPGNTESVQDALNLIKEKPDVRGVLHCFTYGYEEAKPFVDLGWYVSYSGVLTYKNAKSIQEGAVKLPLENLMVETDAPFLTPVPFRGKMNEPAYVVHTMEYLAGLRQEKLGEAPEFVKSSVYENSRRFLNWKNNL